MTDKCTAKIVPDVSSRESRQAKAMWIVIKGGNKLEDVSYPITEDELIPIRDAINEYSTEKTIKHNKLLKDEFGDSM